MLELFSDLKKDIYYWRDYASLYEGDSEYFSYFYEEGGSYVFFSSLKRKISRVSGVEINEELYDLETPYGYGGPLSNSRDRAFLERAFSEYKKYCSERKIVCEFIRFHPFNEITRCEYLFDMHSLERQIVVVDLDAKPEDRRKMYSKTTRNIVNKSRKNLIVEENSADLKDFLNLYYETMSKNSASDFFYFDSRYFKDLVELDGVSLLSVKKDCTYISLGYFFFGKELAHYHLSANSQAYSKENGNYCLLDAAFDKARSYGCRYMMLGGGRTSSPNDGLLKFKSKFSRLKMPFYIAGLDFIPEKRKLLNDIWLNVNPEKESQVFFQLYRM